MTTEPTNARKSFGDIAPHLAEITDKVLCGDAHALHTRQVGRTRRSDVRCQRFGRALATGPAGAIWIIAHRWRQDLKDVGDQALMRGLDTALPIERLGLSLSYYGRRPKAGHKASVGRSPAVILPPPVREWDRSIRLAARRVRPTT
jgi:hypothetical protein